MYNLLFYKGYQGAEHSGNWGNWYALAGCSTVAFSLMLNLLTLSFVLERAIGWNANEWLKPEYKWRYVAGLATLVVSYYFIGGRYKRIVERYEERALFENIPPILFIVCYNVTSLALMILAGMWKNHSSLFN